jgi:hypothetical protein
VPPEALLGWGLVVVVLKPDGASAPVAALPGAQRPAMEPVKLLLLLLLLLLLEALCRGTSSRWDRACRPRLPVGRVCASGGSKNT